MNENSGGVNCSLASWGLAALAGFLAFVLLMVLGDWGFIQAVFAAAVIFAVLGLLLSWILCKPLPGPGEAPVPGPQASTKPTMTANAAQSSTAGGVAGGAGAAAGATAAAKTAADTAGDVAQTAEAKAEDAAETAKAKAEDAAETAKSKAEDAAETVKAKAEDAAETAQSAASDAADAAKDTAAKAADAATDAADATKAAASDATDSAKAAAAGAAGAAGAAAAKAKDTAESAIPDFDGDGKQEGTDEGTRPAALDGPRGGTADNLKEIKGIGPKLEKLCNSLGFYHFDQIANWTADEVAWVDANLEGFRGRVTRDKWVEQAKILASGGETEFSKRVDDGDVY